MMNILIADDHAIVRRGLIQILNSETGLASVAEAVNGQEALEMTRSRDWDLVILDINLPDRSGLEILTELHKSHPSLPILILSMYPEDQYALRVLRAGAMGYLNKQSAPEELIKAIKRIRAGTKYISESMLEKIALSMNSDEEKPIHETLSDREYQVMLMITSGKTLTEIAEQLMLSIKTVSTYRKRILEKMNMKSNAELTSFVIHHQLSE